MILLASFLFLLDIHISYVKCRKTTTLGRYHNYTTGTRSGHTTWGPWAHSYDPHGPKKMEREEWSTFQSAVQIENMTLEIIKDVQVKFRKLNRIHDVYSGKEGFEFATVAANAVYRFMNMIKIYRHYSSYHIWSRKDNITITEFINGFQVMQSEYNEMRLERDVFFKLVKIADKKKEDQMKSVGATKQKMAFAIRHGMTIAEWEELSDKQQHELLEKEKLLRLRWIHMSRDTDARRDDMDKTAVYPRINEAPELMKYDNFVTSRRSNSKIITTNDKAHEEYKRNLRYAKWTEKWKGYNPEVEGVEINEDLALASLQNASAFRDFNLHKYN